MCQRIMKDFLIGVSWAAVFYLASMRMSSTAEASDVNALKEEERSIYVGYNSSSGLPVILSAPHGGLIYPDSIPDRDAGCWIQDRCVWSHDCGVKNISKCRAITVDDNFTQNMTGELRARLCDLFLGACPASVFNLLGRTKFDANRDRDEASFGIPVVVTAYTDYHALIEKEIETLGGVGLFLDIHGQSHKLQRAELGYLVRSNDLDSGDPIDPNITSIRSLAHSVHTDFDSLLRGPESFGGILGEFGFDSVPSPKYRGPGHLPYFDGGYNTRRHGSSVNGSFDGMQVESAWSHRQPDIRPRYVQALACTIKRFYCLYYHHRVSSRPNVVIKDGAHRSSSDRLAEACAAYPDDSCKTSGASDGKHSKICLDFSIFMAAVVTLVVRYTSDNR